MVKDEEDGQQLLQAPQPIEGKIQQEKDKSAMKDKLLVIFFLHSKLALKSYAFFFIADNFWLSIEKMFVIMVMAFQRKTTCLNANF